MEEIKKKIEDYVSTLLFLHDMSVKRNETNKTIMKKIVARCMDDLERHDGLAAMKKAIYIKTREGIEVINNTFNAEDRVLSMDYLESSHKRLRKRSRRKHKNPL